MQNKQKNEFNKTVHPESYTLHDVMLVVAPSCAGKTTYINEHFNDRFVISSDNIVDDVCKKYGLTYSEFFQLDFKHQVREEQRTFFDQSIKESKKHNKVVWDLTNLTKRDRARAMSHYPNAIFRAVELEFKGWEKEIIKLSHERGLATGKIIPKDVLLNMFKRFEPVSKAEGFTDLTTTNVISSIIALKNAA
ncbi:AAA family ATPase [Shewanella polaris]|uniref:ATP-binding protein n=1 Tax=Shewanella polaris TaxID=2588449 RepID=A0A4Y5YGQ0_9GAMM|nr:AAA family ATPase [Shewanella polaris]QDE31972.1 ATP-binding protein [Shewanella polaris]